MDVTECIRTRRSIRKYQPKPIERDVITKIVDAARFAPSCGNLQNWYFVVVFDEGSRKEIAEACMQQYWMEQAPLHIVCIADPEKAKRYYGVRGERLYTSQNVAACAVNIMLTAHSLGLGTCWVGAFDEERIGKIVKSPPQYRPQIVLTVGYPAEHPEEPAKYPLENVFFFDAWRGRIEDVLSMFGFRSHKIEPAVKKAVSKVGEGIMKLSEKGKDLVTKMRKK